jgi:hypothetical protein
VRLLAKHNHDNISTEVKLNGLLPSHASPRRVILRRSQEPITSNAQYFFRPMCSDVGVSFSRKHELIIIVMPPFDPLGKVQPLHVGLGGHYMSRRSPAYEDLGRGLLSEIERPLYCLISIHLLNFRIETLLSLRANNF